MNRFIRELRRREVFRTLGLYVGVCWILIEASSILLPTFEAPTWMLRGLILAAVIGFPIAAVLAWIYDITGRRVVHTTGRVDSVEPALGNRKIDFVVIGVLLIALTFSVYLNLTRGPDLAEELEPVSVLIADFENRTGDPIFDGLLEQALNVGIESAPHVSSFDRRTAENYVEQLQPGTDGLPTSVARLVAVREDVDLVLSAAIDTSDRGFRLEVRGLDPLEGESIFSASAQAADREAVLAAIGSLAREVREKLGDRTLNQGEVATADAFTAASIEAARAYMNGLELAFAGRFDESIEAYKVATDLDPNLGRAYSGWALSEFRLGRHEESARLWDIALSLMGTMTERERLRTLGLYYFGVTRNYQEAVENFSELVEKYPADAAGRNNLAVAAFYTLDFEMAAKEGARLLEIFPNSPQYRANFALFAMYSGDFEAAVAEARAAIEMDPDYGMSYLPLAVSLLATAKTNEARDAYGRMAVAGRSEFGESVSMLGLADAAIYFGELEDARNTLLRGIEYDLGRDSLSAAATKYIALADTHVQSGDYPAAMTAANDALELSSRSSIEIAAATIFVESGNYERAANIANELSQELNTFDRAYGMMIDAAILGRSGAYLEAIDMLRSAVRLADLWWIRLELGRAYLEAGYYAEAFGEFDNCMERRGEATAVFLDDMPTVRLLSDLPYWIGRAQDGLGMETVAMESYQAFLALRPNGGPLADDARSRSR